MAKFPNEDVEEFVQRLPLVNSVLKASGMHGNRALRWYLYCAEVLVIACEMVSPIAFRGVFRLWPSALVWLLSMLALIGTHSIADETLPELFAWHERSRVRSPLRAALGMKCEATVCTDAQEKRGQSGKVKAVLGEQKRKKAPLQGNWAGSDDQVAPQQEEVVQVAGGDSLAVHRVVEGAGGARGDGDAVFLFEPTFMLTKEVQGDSLSTVVVVGGVLTVGYVFTVVFNIMEAPLAVYPEHVVWIQLVSLFSAVHHIMGFMACWVVWSMLASVITNHIGFLRFEMLFSARRLGGASLEQRIAWHRSLAKQHTVIKYNMDLFSARFRWIVLVFGFVGGVSVVFSILMAMTDKSAELLFYWSGFFMLMSLMPLFVCAWVSSAWVDLRNEAIPFLTGLAINVPLERSELQRGGVMMSVEEEEEVHRKEVAELHRGSMRAVVSLATAPTQRYLAGHALLAVVPGEEAEGKEEAEGEEGEDSEEGGENGAKALAWLARKEAQAQNERLMLFHQISEARVGMRLFNTPITYSLVLQTASLSLTALVLLAGQDTLTRLLQPV